jgi:diguanylate cyclase (GGDEF)-like protein
MKLTYQIHVVLFTAALVGAVFLYFNRSITGLMDVHTRLFNNLSQLQNLDADIDILVIKAKTQSEVSFNALKKTDTEQKRILKQLSQSQHFQEDAFMAELLARYKSLQHKKITLITSLYTYHKALSTSLTGLKALQSRQTDANVISELKKVSATLSWMFMSQQILPFSLELKAISAPDLRQKTRQYIDDFQFYFRVYLDIIQHLRQLRMEHLGETIKAHLFQRTRYKTLALEWVSWMLSSIFAIAIAFIIFMLFRTERENKKLQDLREKLEISMYTDRLTGLGNRLRFESERKKFKHPAVLLLNIDGFKHVNAFYGIPAGDYVLQSLAALITRHVPQSWQKHVYRTGADDFVVLFELQSEKINPEYIAHHLLYEIEHYPFRHQDYAINLSVSIGMSDVEPLLETADMAYKHIETQRLKYLEYTEALGIYQQIENNLSMWRTLRHALDRDTLVPYFQPIINNHTRRIEKYECLARVIDEDGRALTPNDFLDVAKQSGLYAKLTMRMIQKSFAMFVDQPYEFSINLAPEDIIDRQVRHFIQEQLEIHPKLAKRVIFEILESEGISDYDTIREFIHEVHHYGGNVAIDDFGSGYSNLNHVLNLNVDYLKIDGTLIKDLDSNTQSQILVQTIVDFCRKIGIKALTAEYVESADVLELICRMGVDYSQGFYIGKPESFLISVAKNKAVLP